MLLRSRIREDPTVDGELPLGVAARLAAVLTIPHLAAVEGLVQVRLGLLRLTHPRHR